MKPSTLNTIRDYLESAYRNIEEGTGRRYTLSDLMAAGIRRGSSGLPWRGIDPNARGNHWKFQIAKLDELDAKGRIAWPKKEGGVPRYKRYLDEMKGVPIQSIWTDVNAVASQSIERVDYNTQKPIALLERAGVSLRLARLPGQHRQRRRRAARGHASRADLARTTRCAPRVRARRGCVWL